MAILKSQLFWFVAVVIVVGLYAIWPKGTDPVTRGQAMVDVTLPQLAALQKQGEQAFNARCAACHGANAAGQGGVAPPLIHKIYEPSHHGDAAFERAAKLGVPQHHWSFGNMPPVEGITEREIALIITYLRAVQRANGIF